MSVLQHAPRFDPAGAAAIARDIYGLDAAASQLTSERDQNFRLTLADGRTFVLKIANATEDASLLDAQNAAMAHAATTGLCPSVLPALDGSSIAELTGSAGDRHFVRLLTWLPGVPLGTVRHHPAPLLEDLGRSLGELDASLAGFDHPAIHREFHWDLDGGVEIVAQHAPRILDTDLRQRVERISRELATRLGPVLPGLPRTAVHNDPNDYNVLVRHDGNGARISGFIDFGDMVHSFAVADLAIAIAYAVLGKTDPLAAAMAIVRGYNRARRLEESELSCLFDLVQLRLCMSASLAALQTSQRPDDPYLSITQAPLVRTLPVLAAISPRFAEASFRHACDLDPVPRTSRVTAWLEAREAFATVVNGSAPPVTLDLSVGSPLIDGDPGQNTEPSLTARIASVMRDAAATMGIGRYGEPRLLYSTALFDSGGERRTIHLGVDLFADAGTAVHAPLHGVVVAAANNAAPLDYGPVVIIEHRTGEGDTFYTLYGHLSLDALTECPVGRVVEAGERLAAIGGAAVNGGWTPHLHFQVMVDLLDAGTDFPGVCRASQWPVWTALSPDPNLVLRLSNATSPAKALDDEMLRTQRRQITGGNLSIGYQRPVNVARGWMQYLFDATGRRYLDAYNNVPHVGHSHPRVVRAVSEQLRVLNTNTRYLHDSLARFAAELTATLPDPLRVCYFVNSGSEANELALRLARAHTGRRALLVLDAAYHGNTTTLIDISPYKFNGPGGQGAPPWVHVLPLPDAYRGEFRGDDAGARYAEQARQSVIGTLGDGANRVCAFIAETCPSVGGQIILPCGYLERVYRDVRAAGGLCIADEVQTAYGRMGHHFYAFEAHGVVPDIVVLGKPIGNGYPLGAVVTTRAIAESFDNGMEFFSTFGGSTASCAAGLAVLEVVRRDGLQAHALAIGERLLDGLRALQQQHAVVGDVRGSGLFLGVELVSDRHTREPAASIASSVVNRMREEAILLGTDGPFHNVLKIRPPMPFDAADADRLVETLNQVLDEVRHLSAES